MGRCLIFKMVKIVKYLALNYYKNWYSCSECIVKAAADKGYCSEYLVNIATPFSGGMASGCLCGAVAGALIVIGEVFNKEDSKLMANDFMKRFIAKNKTTCCHKLSQGFDKGSAERRELCKNYVSVCADILEEMVKNKI